MNFSVAFMAIALFCPSIAQPFLADGCNTSQVLQGVYVNGSVPIDNSPLTPFDAPMLKAFNSTSVEDWSFDGVSKGAQSGLAFTLSRGTTAGHVAAQRVIMTAVWPDGTRFLRPLYFDETIITSCHDTVTGVWRNTTGTNATWTFLASADYTRTLVTINTPKVKGTYKLTSIAPPLYPNGLVYPNSQGNPLFAPLLYWVENVPVGIVEANLTILGTPFVLNGIGGRERNWNSKPWGEISATWDMVRGAAGPYTFIVWSYASMVDGGTSFSSVLMEDKKVIFRTQSSEANGTDSKTYGSITPKTSGAVHLSSYPPGKPADSSITGFVLDMADISSGHRWRFDIEISKSVYWFQANKSANIGGFVGNVTGGLVNGDQHEGLVSGNLQEAAI